MEVLLLRGVYMDIWYPLIKKVFFPYMELVKGNKIRKKLSYLKQMERKSYEEIKDKQQADLKKLLLHSIEHVPAYKKFKKLKKEIEANPYEALKKFPVLTKKDLMGAPDQYLSGHVSKYKLIPNLTGGSTGEPVKFYMDRETVEWYEAARWQGLSWREVEIGHRSVMIWGSPIELNKSQHQKYALKEKVLKNRIIFPAYDINPDSIENYVKTLHEYQPKYIYGYASALNIFAKLIEEKGLEIQLSLKAIISTSENLYDFQREQIERVFRCPVVNEYGARDGGIIAYECPHGSMHLTELNAVYETIDIQSKGEVSLGEEGSLLVTDLHNFVMPRLRYQVGDMVTKSVNKCMCGRNTSILQSIEGRVDDTFIAKDGSYVHGHFFNHVVRTTKGISQFQFIQHTPKTMSLKIVKGPEFAEQEVLDVVSKIKDKMGNHEIDVEYVDHIAPSKSGKVRYAIREYPLN